MIATRERIPGGDEDEEMVSINIPTSALRQLLPALGLDEITKMKEDAPTLGEQQAPCSMHVEVMKSCPNLLIVRVVLDLGCEHA